MLNFFKNVGAVTTALSNFLPIQVFNKAVCQYYPNVCLEQAPVRPQELNAQGQKLEAAIRAGATAVIRLRSALNEWDGIVGDGDCGSTVRIVPLHNMQWTLLV